MHPHPSLGPGFCPVEPKINIGIKLLVLIQKIVELYNNRRPVRNRANFCSISMKTE